MGAEMRVTATIRSSIGILNVDGDVTDTAHDPLLNAYHDITQRGVKKILVRFRPQSFINSAGIRVIMAVAFEAESQKQSLRVAGLSPHMEHIFGLVGLTKYLMMFPSQEEALKNWK